jgi:DNA-binding response OmpR family regulator
LNLTIRDPYYKRGHGIPRLRSPGRGGGRAMTGQHVACELSAPTTSAAPAAKPRVLVIDDEAAIRSALGRARAAEGLVTDLAETAADGLSRARAEVYDLVILDLLMPGTDGFAVLRQLLRDRPGQTVVVLSCLSDVRCKVDCFDRVIRAGEITLHVGRMEADIGHGPLPLTRLEFLVLKELMEHAGQALSKGQLLESVWGYDFSA